MKITTGRRKLPIVTFQEIPLGTCFKFEAGSIYYIKTAEISVDRNCTKATGLACGLSYTVGEGARVEEVNAKIFVSE